MKAINFPEANVGIAEDQEEYNTLPSFVDEKGVVVSCFQLNAVEIETIIKNRKIWVHHLTGGQPLQPFNLFAVKNYFDCIQTQGTEVIVNNETILENKLNEALFGEDADEIIETEVHDFERPPLPGERVRINFPSVGQILGEIIVFNAETGYVKMKRIKE